MKKRLLSLLLCVLMVVSLLPLSAMAEDPTPTELASYPIPGFDYATEGDSKTNEVKYTGKEIQFFDTAELAKADCYYYIKTVNVDESEKAVSGTNMGNYSITFIMKEDAKAAGYYWGTAEAPLYTLTYNFRIYKVAKLPVVTTNFLYIDGEATFRPIAENEAYDLSGDTKGSVAGNYTVKVTLNPGYKWSNTTDLSFEKQPVLSYTWSISTDMVAVPSAADLVYDGTEQTPSVMFNGKSVSINDLKSDADYPFYVAPSFIPKSNAGTYSFTLKLKSGYIWEDNSNTDKVVEYRIAPREIIISTPNATLLSNQDVSVSNPTLKITGEIVEADKDDAINGLVVATAEALQKGVGDKVNSVKVNGADYTENKTITINNYSVTFELGTLRLIDAGEPITVYVSGTSNTVQFNGETQKVTGYTVTKYDCEDYVAELVDDESDSYVSLAKDKTAAASGKTVGTYKMGLTKDSFTFKGFTNVTFVVTDGILTISKADKHVPDESVWYSDDTSHWRLCAGCGEVCEKAAHSFNGGSTCECGYTKPTYTVKFQFMDENGKIIHTYTAPKKLCVGDMVGSYYVADSVVLTTAELTNVDVFPYYEHYNLDSSNSTVSTSTGLNSYTLKALMPTDGSYNATNATKDGELISVIKVTSKPCKCESTYVWTEDSTTHEWSCTATYGCMYKNCQTTTTVTETATVANKGIANVTTATCTEKGINSVEASFSDANKALFVKQTKTLSEQAALGHDWEKDATGKNYVYTIDVYATDEIVGSMSIHCTRCGISCDDEKIGKPKSYKVTDEGAIMRLSADGAKVVVDVTKTSTNAEVTFDVANIGTSAADVEIPISSVSIFEGTDTVSIPYAELVKLFKVETKDNTKTYTALVSSLKITTFAGSVSFDAAALTKRIAQLGENDALSISLILNPDLTEKQSAAYADLNNALSFKVVVKCGIETIDYTLAGKVVVTVPYAWDGSNKFLAALLTDEGSLDSISTASIANNNVTMEISRYKTYVAYTEAPKVETISFSDVTAGIWYEEDVKEAVAMGLINGKSADKFAPQDNLKISEAIKLAACMNQYYTDGVVTLKNSETGNWYDSYVAYAIKAGIITADQFAGKYNQAATRAEYITIFANALPVSEFAVKNSIADDAIPDVKVSDSYGAAVYKMYRAGILEGSGTTSVKNYFLPNNYIKRCEVAAILVRMMNKDARISFTLA